MIDGTARVAVRLGRFAGRNYLNPATDCRHRWPAGHRVGVFKQDAVVRVAFAGSGNFVERI